jgi:hypothetical protein
LIPATTLPVLALLPVPASHNVHPAPIAPAGCRLAVCWGNIALPTALPPALVVPPVPIVLVLAALPVRFVVPEPIAEQEHLLAPLVRPVPIILRRRALAVVLVRLDIIAPVAATYRLAALVIAHPMVLMLRLIVM